MIEQASPKVIAIMCTYGRFTCVERAMNCYLAQTYPNKTLIIYNTDVDSPYIYDRWMAEHNILIFNNNIDSQTLQPYTNVGAIRRDALDLIPIDEQGYVITWDDDDVYMPYYIEQAIDRMADTGLPSFKPEKSFFYSGNNLRLVKNTLEASVVADIQKVREYGYLLETGKEGLGWYTKLRDAGELDENDSYFLPSYCFNWNDGQAMNAPHKQSGDIDNPNNFNNHKEASKDAVNGRSLSIYDSQKLGEIYQPYFDYIEAHQSDFPLELVDKYFKRISL